MATRPHTTTARERARAGGGRTPRQRSRLPWIAGALLVLAVLVAAVLVVPALSGVSLARDPAALARVQIDSLGGTLEHVTATAGGHNVALRVSGGKLTPKTRLRPGERVDVEVTVRRSSLVGWALGKEAHRHLQIAAPRAKLSSRWLTVASGAPVTVSFDQPVARLAIGHGVSSTLKTLPKPEQTVSLGARPPAGSLRIFAAPRSWERLGPASVVSWFPKASGPVAVVSPAPGATISPAQPIRLVFSTSVKKALGAARPTLSPATPGHWRETDSHTLVFMPSGFGLALGAKLRVTLPRAVTVAGATSSGTVRAARELDFSTPPGSTLRLQQLLAEGGYLPVDWSPSGAQVPRTESAQARAAANAPAGSFHWRYSNTPSELREQWTPGKVDPITRGAIMTFQSTHDLTVDAIAGPAVWKSLLEDTIAGRRRTDGYSYVYVHRDIPQLLTLWHNGHTVLTSPGNTGVASAPTQLGTFQVFEHLPSTTMSGTNPDGSHYNDPGVKWVSYFNGGDALHAFNRASFGTPQSLGCVELPLATAKAVWPYTPIGTLVTIEH